MSTTTVDTRKLSVYYPDGKPRPMLIFVDLDAASDIYGIMLANSLFMQINEDKPRSDETIVVAPVLCGDNQSYADASQAIIVHSDEVQRLSDL